MCVYLFNLVCPCISTYLYLYVYKCVYLCIYVHIHRFHRRTRYTFMSSCVQVPPSYIKPVTVSLAAPVGDSPILINH